MLISPPKRAGAEDAFYQATDSEIAGPIGSLIRHEPRIGAAAGATAHKVLYRLTKPDGTPTAVSGIVIVPAGQAPAGGWPIRLGASDHRRGIALCAIAGAVRFSANGRKSPPPREGYAIAGRRLSRSGHARPTPLSRRRQRSTRGDRLGMRRPFVSGWRIHPFRRLGSLRAARRPCLPA